MRLIAKQNRRYVALLAAAFVLAALLAGAVGAQAHFLFWDDRFDGVWPENNTWLGHEHRDDMSGRGGNDIIYGSKRQDVVRGQANFDVLRGQGADDRVKSAGGGDDLHGGARDDHLVGDAGRHNHCWGGPGNDKFEHCHKHG